MVEPDTGWQLDSDSPVRPLNPWTPGTSADASKRLARFRLCWPRTPLGWMLILVALTAAGIALSPSRSTPNINTFQAEPDDSDYDEDWVMPPPRQEIAI